MTTPKGEQVVLVMLDALGFRGIWTKRNPEEIAKEWEETAKGFIFLSEYVGKMKSAERTTMAGVQSEVSVFSDTIALCVSGGTLRGQMNFAARVLQNGFSQALTSRVFLRGSLSIGTLFRQEHTKVGPVADDVAEWYDKSDWIGVSLTPAAKYAVESYLSEDSNDAAHFRTFWFTEYDVPLKKAKAGREVLSTLALNWPQNFAMDDSDWLTARKRLTGLFAAGAIGVDSLTKYENTLEFFDVKSRDPVFKKGNPQEGQSTAVKGV